MEIPSRCRRIVSILEEARTRVARAVNSEMVLAYWHIGHEIVEYLQRGAVRADHGDQLLDSLSRRLSRRFGRGFSATNLKHLRLFYLAFADREPRIRHKPCDVFDASRRIRHKASDVSAALANAAGPQVMSEPPGPSPRSKKVSPAVRQATGLGIANSQRR